MASVRCEDTGKLVLSCDCPRHQKGGQQLSTNRSHAPAQASAPSNDPPRSSGKPRQGSAPSESTASSPAPDAPGSDEIAVAEAPAWLERNGYRVISRQAIHKAIQADRLDVARSISVAGKTWKWVPSDKLAELAGKPREAEPDSGGG